MSALIELYMSILGAAVMVAGGLLCAACLLYLGYKMLGIVGKLFFDRIIKVYHFSHVRYWMDRLEVEGTHCFKRASDDVKAYRAEAEIGKAKEDK